MVTEEYKKNLEIAKSLSKDYKKKEKIIQFLYDKFDEEYLSQKEGFEHRSRYGFEKEEVTKVYNEIIRKRNNNEPYENDVYDKLFNREYQVHRDNRSKNLVPRLRGHGYSEEGIKKIARCFIGLVESMIKEDKEDQQIKENIVKFKKNSKQIKTNRLSTVLYYLDKENHYYVINNKIVDTVFLLSTIITPEIKFKNKIEKYIDENKEIHSFLNTISYYVKELENFQTFDIFCHWMCDPNLGSYAGNAKNILPSIEEL